MLTFLAALLNAWALPGGGVVWRLPPELSHQFDAVAHAHAGTVGLADAALALDVGLCAEPDRRHRPVQLRDAQVHGRHEHTFGVLPVLISHERSLSTHRSVAL